MKITLDNTLVFVSILLLIVIVLSLLFGPPSGTDYVSRDVHDYSAEACAWCEKQYKAPVCMDASLCYECNIQYKQFFNLSYNVSCPLK